jgi:Holliday junction resolvasome RuvABC DNA-binding subunit
MDANMTNRLNALKAQIEQGKVEKTKAETNLETYTKQRDEEIAKLVELGVTPENLDNEISKLEQEIAASIEQAENLLKG